MSKTKLRSATFSINELVKTAPHYSFASQADMRHMLIRCIKDLHELDYQVGHIKGLKAKHIYILVAHWQAQGKNPGTIKNYLAKLRKVASLLHNPKLIKPTNAAYNIARRCYAPTISKAIHHLELSTCPDPYIRLSLEGQLLFGLRREESLKLILSDAYHGDSLTIKPSWTKGGIGRTLTIRTNDQRQWLANVARLVQPGQSLIPVGKSYKQQLGHYERVTKAMGISKLHGLRHAYAQRRYQELTRWFDPVKQGMSCPLGGGKKSNNMTPPEKDMDQKACQVISHELGHSRLAITKIYLLTLIKNQYV